MVLAVLAMAMAFIVSITYLAGSTTAVNTTTVFADHARSRQIAESGMDAVVAFLEHSPNWRSTQPQGAWVHSQPLLGGTLDVDASFVPDLASTLLVVGDPSFEAQTASLPTPLLNPPMSGTIGGWNVARTATVITGPTVPGIGCQATTQATAGSNAGFISFGATVSGSGTLSQSLQDVLAPRTKYELSADVSASTGLSSINMELRIRAGGTLVASSQGAWTLALPSSPGQLPTPPSNPTNPAEYNALLSSTPLGAGAPTSYSLVFVTDVSPAPGSITIELYAQSTGVAATVWFDNVRLSETRDDPLSLTATGRYGDASHVVSAQIVMAFDGSASIVQWSEP